MDTADKPKRTRKKSPATTAETAPPQEIQIASIKAFDADFSCRGFKFEIGKTYEVSGKIEACSNGFHACPVDEHPLSVLQYYPPTSRFAEVVQSGGIDRTNNKIASAKITIGAEITIGDLTKRAIDWVFKRANWKDGPVVTGDNEAATASGTRGAATASGDQGAATASGYQGAATASGTWGAATASGKASVAMASGWGGKARAVTGGAICLVHRDFDTDEIIHIRASKVGENGIEPGKWYGLSKAGDFVEAE